MDLELKSVEKNILALPLSVASVVALHSPRYLKITGWEKYLPRALFKLLFNLSIRSMCCWLSELIK